MSFWKRLFGGAKPKPTYTPPASSVRPAPRPRPASITAPGGTVYYRRGNNYVNDDNVVLNMAVLSAIMSGNTPAGYQLDQHQHDRHHGGSAGDVVPMTSAVHSHEDSSPVHSGHHHSDHSHHDSGGGYSSGDSGGGGGDGGGGGGGD